jgi:hypothetical protein
MRHMRHASCLASLIFLDFYPPSFAHFPFAALPAEPFQHGNDAALIGGADPRGGFEPEHLVRNLTDRHLVDVGRIASYGLGGVFLALTDVFGDNPGVQVLSFRYVQVSKRCSDATGGQPSGVSLFGV